MYIYVTFKGIIINRPACKAWHSLYEPNSLVLTKREWVERQQS